MVIRDSRNDQTVVHRQTSTRDEGFVVFFFRGSEGFSYRVSHWRLRERWPRFGPQLGINRRLQKEPVGV